MYVIIVNKPRNLRILIIGNFCPLRLAAATDATNGGKNATEWGQNQCDKNEDKRPNYSNIRNAMSI